MITLEHVTKSFHSASGDLHAVQDVSLEIADGDIFGIIGDSGAGKSTLVRCINLLEKPTSGSVTVDGQRLCWMEGDRAVQIGDRDLQSARKKIGMIFQQFNLLMQRTCLKNICFPLEISGVPRDQAEKRARELLDIVGLPDKADSYPAQLSGGQKQRVAIARALASDPKVLLCDEATSALDPTTTRAILRLIKDINQRLGITVVVITHEMSVVEEICTRVAVLEKGRIMETGTVKDIFSNPQTDAGRRLVYPGGGRVHELPISRVIRLTFNESSTYEPLVASMAVDCGVKASILMADIRDINGKSSGTLLLGLPDSPADAAKAIQYLKGQPNVTVEEVKDYHG